MISYFLILFFYTFHVYYKQLIINILDFKYSMRNFSILFFIVLGVLGQYQEQGVEQPPMIVGQVVAATIEPSVRNQNLHPININKLERKYLFIRLSTMESNKAAIGLYDNINGNLIFSCMDNAYDTCYIPAKILSPDTIYKILVMSNQPINYNLFTYWGDLQHLKPDKQIKFMFDEKDKTQLFHLQLQNQKFQQIRIFLRPETMRTQGDSLKIFAKIGLKQEPTQSKYDFKSVHVWNDIEAIFINKQDIGNEKGIGVYIVGNAKTIYILSCEFRRQKVHNLNLNQNIYQYIKSHDQSIYHMEFGQYEQIDVHVVRFSVFTGEAEVGFYYDKEMKNRFKEMPFQYMSDLQFHIQKSDLEKGTKDLYMRVRAMDTSTTYQLNMQGRKKSQSFEMFENVFEFVPIRQKKQSMFFYSHVWDQSQYDRQKQQTFDVSIIKVEGDYSINFYLCKPSSFDEQICKKSSHEKFESNVIKLQPIGSSQIGSKHIYSVQIDQKQYKKINNVEKRALVIIEFVSKNVSKLAFAAVQFSNTKKIRLLRQGRAFEDKVSLGQLKQYKYQNTNLNISSIKIHINQISGLTNTTAYRSDPKLNSSKEIKLSSQQPNTILITQNVNQPIYIKVYGIVSSIYTVTVNPVHKDHPLSSSLILAEDIEYDIKLLPYEHANIQIHPIEKFVVFQFSCQGGSIIVCEIDAQGSCKQQSKQVKNKGKLQIDSSSLREIRFRLSNNVDSQNLPKGDKQDKQQQKKVVSKELIRTVKVTLLYHASGKKHCEQRKVNNVYSQIVKSGSCFKFPLPLAQDIQILSSRQNLAESKLQFYLCSRKIKLPQFINNRYRISGNLVAENCKDLPNDIVLNMIVTDQTAHEQEVNQYRMDYTVQYNNDIITLADGVAYFAKTVSLEEQIRTFFYDIVDEESPVQIQLYNKKGYQQFFAKVVNKNDRYNNKLNEAKTTLNSVNVNFFSNPSIEISPKDIAKSNCSKNCILIVSVYSKQKSGTEIQFGIQITQHQIILKENQIRNDFLGRGSVKYYEYRSRNSPTDLLFKVSDNNRRCTKSYLSNHPYPSSDNFIVSEQQGTLTYKNAKKGTYYFAIQAITDCPYSLSVSEGQSLLTRIQHSQYYDINLKQNQQEWFYLKHLSRNSFKITSLLKFGLVDIFVNQTQLSSETINAVSKGLLKPEQFNFKNEYKNSLTINSESKNFCFNCYYLVNVKAKVLTEGSIFLGSENSKIQLTEGKVFFDEIKQNQTTFAIFYKVSQGNILVSMHSGKIKIQMSYENQNFTSTFSSNSDKKTYNQSYKFKHLQGKYTPIQIKITSQSGPSTYSLQLVPSSDSLTSTQLYPGQSKLLKMQKGVNACFTGTLRSKKEQILITTDSEENIDFKQIKIDGKLNMKQSKISRQIVGNVMSLKFDIKQTFFPQALSYQICLSSNETKKLYQVTFSIIQIQNMNLLSSDTELIIRNESLFTIHHNGLLIVDIFECQGKAEVVYSSTSSDLNKKTTHFLDYIGIRGQDHAIKVDSKEVLFLKINVQLGTLLWMPLNEVKQRGIGYFKYQIGKVTYSSSFNSIEFKIGGIYKSKETNTSVQSAKYTLYVSNSSELLRRGVMCQMKGDSKMLSIQINSTKVGEGTAPQISFSVEKKKFSQKFDSNETLYFNVVADMILNPPNEDKDHEHYRFIYYEQIVLAEILRQNSLQNLDIKWLIALIIIAAAAIILILCVLIRCVVPVLGKLKGRVLVQENNEQRDGNMEAPPSSDRNQMSTGTSQRIN